MKKDLDAVKKKIVFDATKQKADDAARLAAVAAAVAKNNAASKAEKDKATAKLASIVQENAAEKVVKEKAHATMEANLKAKLDNYDLQMKQKTENAVAEAKKALDVRLAPLGRKANRLGRE